MPGLMIVGEAYGEHEQAQGKPFVGPSGWELDKMLGQAGLSRATAHVTNVINARPPGNKLDLWLKPKRTKKLPPGWVEGPHDSMCLPFILEHFTALEQEITTLRPSVIVAFGAIALWFLTQEDGIMKWRGSVLWSDKFQCWVVPTYHPAFVLRQWEVRMTAIRDLSRARDLLEGTLKEPKRWSAIRPSYEQTRGYLLELWAKAEKGPFSLVLDLEIKYKRILCFNLSTDDKGCFCLPIRYSEGWYFSPEEHTEVVTALYMLLHHHNVRLCNQNLAFDIQFMWADLGLWPRAYYDTMLAQNVLYPSGGTHDGSIGTTTKARKGKLKSLDYLASMWCPWYVYWKDDGKFWVEDISDDQLWRYGCKDGWYTFEVMEAQLRTLEQLNMLPQLWAQMDTLNAVIAMMHRGVLVDKPLLNEIDNDTVNLIDVTLEEVEFLATRSLWADKGFSNVKLKEFFYTELRQVPVLDKLTRQPKTDDEALTKIKKRTPWLTPIVDGILTIRSYQTVLKVTRARTDKNSRWCTSYNVAGTLTHRLSSSENIFDCSTNLQNLTLGKEIGK